MAPWAEVFLIWSAMTCHRFGFPCVLSTEKTRSSTRSEKESGDESPHSKNSPTISICPTAACLGGAQVWLRPRNSSLHRDRLGGVETACFLHCSFQTSFHRGRLGGVKMWVRTRSCDSGYSTRSRDSGAVQLTRAFFELMCIQARSASEGSGAGQHFAWIDVSSCHSERSEESNRAT